MHLAPGKGTWPWWGSFLQLRAVSEVQGGNASLSLEDRSGWRPQHPLQQGTLRKLLSKAWHLLFPFSLYPPLSPPPKARLNTPAGMEVWRCYWKEHCMLCLLLLPRCPGKRLGCLPSPDSVWGGRPRTMDCTWKIVPIVGAKENWPECPVTVDYRGWGLVLPSLGLLGQMMRRGDLGT